MKRAIKVEFVSFGDVKDVWKSTFTKIPDFLNYIAWYARMYPHYKLSYRLVG